MGKIKEKVFIAIPVFALFTITLLCLHCSHGDYLPTSSPQIIKISDDIEEADISLSLLAERIEYTCLETSKDSYIGRISLLKSKDSLILIYDKLLNKVLLFSADGKFINQIGSPGKGPGEYSSVGGLEFDQGNNIIIHDIAGKLIYFTMGNKFVREIRIDLRFKDFSSIGDKLFFRVIYPNTIYQKGYSCFVAESGTGKTIKSLLKRKDSKSINHSVVSSFNDYYSYNDSIFFWEYRYDTIYGVSKDFKITPRWVFDLGDRRVPNEAFSSTTNLYNSTINQGVLLTSFVETGNYFFLETIENSERRRYLNYKSDKKTILIKYDNQNYLIPNDFDNGPGFWPELVINDSTVIGIINPDMLLAATQDPTVRMNHVLDSISKEINAFDNPILMTVTLKQ